MAVDKFCLCLYFTLWCSSRLPGLLIQSESLKYWYENTHLSHYEIKMKHKNFDQARVGLHIHSNGLSGSCSFQVCGSCVSYWSSEWAANSFLCREENKACYFQLQRQCANTSRNNGKEMGNTDHWHKLNKTPIHPLSPFMCTFDILWLSFCCHE